MTEQEQLAELLAAVEGGASPDAALTAVCGDDQALRETMRRRMALLADLGVLDHTSAQAVPERLGRFAILRLLGGGGMGMVHLAWDEELRRTVALKVIRPEQLFFERALERFRREVHVIAQLAHPSVVQVYSVGEEGGVPYFAMERIIGCSLAEALADLEGQDPSTLTGQDLQRAVAARARAARQADLAHDDPGTTPLSSRTDGFGRLDESNADDDTVGWLYAGSWEATCLRIVRQIAAALDHAHSRGVLHRDIKPSNIMLTADPGDSRALLLDFGLAGVAGDASITASGARLGSLPYLPPEQLSGDPADFSARSDIYSLGATLYEALSLRPAFKGSSDPELLAAIHRGAVARPMEHNGELSWEAETVCLTAMDPEARRRYASASDLARDLDNVLGRRPIEARRAGPLLRLRRLVQRHPTGSVAAILGALLVLGGPSLFAWQQHQTMVAITAKNERIESDSLTIGEQNASLRALAETVTERNDELSAKNEEISAQHAQVQRQFDLALLTVDTMLTQVGETTLADVPRMTAVRSDLLGQALQFYRLLLEERAGDPGVLSRMARALQLEGEVHNLLGQIQLAADSHRQSLEILDGLAQQDPDNADYSADLALGFRKLGAQAYAGGRFAEAVDLTARAAAVQERQLALSDVPSGEERSQFVLTLVNLGAMQSTAEQLAPAAVSFERALTMARTLVDELPGDPRHLTVLARALSGAGKTAEVDQGPAAAAEFYSQALDVYERCLQAFPGNSELRAQQASLWCLLGFNTSHDYEAASRAYQAGYTVQEQLTRDFPESPLYQQELAFTCLQLAELHDQHGQHELVENRYREALIRQDVLLQLYPDMEGLRTDRARTSLSFSGWLLGQERLDETLEQALLSRELYMSLRSEGLWVPSMNELLDESELLAKQARDALERANIGT